MGEHYEPWSGSGGFVMGASGLEVEHEWRYYIGSNETTDQWCLTHKCRLDLCRAAETARPDSVAGDDRG